jgi:lysophospholipase L1-like esterase
MRTGGPMPRTLTALAAAALTAATGIITASPATASPSWGHGVRTSPYVAMGDSYSSAAGVTPFQVGSPPACSRSTLNYPSDIAAALHPVSFTDVTCSGATTSDFFTPQPGAGNPPQLDALSDQTRFVTMTIGGNDGDAFVTILQDCTSASQASGSIYGDPCQDKYGSYFDDIAKNITYPNLVKALTAVQQKAPRATVAILGYPHVLPDRGVPACYPSMPISMGDVPYVVHWAQTLNAVVRRAAARTGTRYVDTSPSTAGHDACQPVGTRWIEPLTNPVNAAPVHPNAAGQANLARQVLNRVVH